jgi:redox-sensitive bicupin YhaK (pirin superfamily)
VIVLEGSVAIDGEPVTPGHLAYLGLGRDEMLVDVSEPSRVMLLGGVPFESEILMWWNFVGRSRDEMNSAYESWSTQDDRFGRVKSSLPIIPTAAPFWRT